MALAGGLLWLADTPVSLASGSMGCATAVAYYFAYGPDDVEALRKNHIRVLDNGRYQVLLPAGEYRYVVDEVTNLKEAQQLANLIEYPIDIEGVGLQLEPQMIELVDILRTNLRKDDPDFDITYRVKKPKSLKTKLFEKAFTSQNPYSLTNVDDIVGTRIAVRSPGDIAAVVARIKKIRDSGIEIVNDDSTGTTKRRHRATHLTVRVHGGPKIEIQVMTRRTKAWITWNAIRVYKPEGSGDGISRAYRARLALYDDLILRRLNALDDAEERGEYPMIAPPQWEANESGIEIRKKDRFPEWPFKI